MLDVQVISVVDDLQVLSVEDIPGAVPRTLKILGVGGFSAAQRVIVNGLAIDTFTVASDTQVHVPLPDYVTTLASQLTVVVVSGALTATQRARLVFGPTLHMRSVSGLQKLVQTVMKVLLSNSGTNKFQADEGGGLLSVLGGQLDVQGKSRIVSGLARAVSATEGQIVQAQSRTLGMSDEEKLLSFTLGDVAFSSSTSDVTATFQISTFAGSSVSVPLVL